MRRFSTRVAVFVFVAAAAAGCGQIGVLKAQLAFKDANQLYQRQQYREAVVKYEEAVGANPELNEAYFFLGNSYDQQFRPARRGEPANDELMDKAIANYKIAATRSENPEIKRLALQYLVNAYGPDKLNDPSQQEPILRDMITMDPTDPGNYYVLANVYEQNGAYDEAEELLLKAREVKPNDPTVYTTLAGFYNRQGEFDKTMEALHARAEREPNNPEAFYTIATFYWEKANKDFTVSQPERVKYVQEGYRAIDKALELKADYFEALTYKGLLLRQEALLIKDPQRQQNLIKEADQYRDRAVEVRNKQRAAGAGD